MGYKIFSACVLIGLYGCSNNGSFAELYASGNGGGSQSYRLEYKDGKYTGKYHEELFGDSTTETVTLLEHIVINERDSTISLKQGTIEYTGKFATDEFGYLMLLIGDCECYLRSEERISIPDQL